MGCSSNIRCLTREPIITFVTAKYCKQLYLDVTNTNYGKITWNQIKPIIQGRILYGPDTNRTREIMSYVSVLFRNYKLPNVMYGFLCVQANGTFEGIDRLKTFLTSLSTVVTKLRSDDEYRAKLGSLVELIKSPVIQSLIGSVNVDSSMIDGILDSLLHDPALLSVLTTVSGIMDCFNVDRFDAVRDGEELERRAIEIGKKKLFHAAVLFDDAGNWTTEQKSVSYTLRMDIDNTPKTIENRNRFWFPGPEASFSDDMRYHRGFIEWQHAIDSGIIKMYKREKRIREGDDLQSSAAKSNQDDDEKLSFGEGFFDDDDDDDDKLSATTSLPDPDVEAFLKFDDDEEEDNSKNAPHNRTKRQFDGLFSGLFGGGGGDTSAAEEKFDLDQMKVYTKMFPYPRYVHDEFKKGLYLANAVQVAFFFALLVQIAAAVRQRLWSRESGNRNLMQCMGLWPSSELIAWSLTTSAEIAITFLVCSTILYGGGVLGSTSKLFMVFFLGLFGASVLSFWYV